MTLPTDSPAPDPSDRPRSVTAAFWCWLVAAVLLVVGGSLILTAQVPGLPALFRGAGVVTGLAGLALAVVAGRARAGDRRFRRAALALALATVVVVAVIAVLGILHLLTLFAVVPLVAGVVCLSRPSAQAWYSGVAR